MLLSTHLALMMRINPLAQTFGLRDFLAVVYGPIMAHVLPDLQVKAYSDSVMCVNLVSVVDCSFLNCMEQQELRRLATSDGRLLGRLT